jgi:hypothetical protein
MLFPANGKFDAIAAFVAVARAAWRLLHEDGYESELDAHLVPLVVEDAMRPDAS